MLERHLNADGQLAFASLDQSGTEMGGRDATLDPQKTGSVVRACVCPCPPTSRSAFAFGQEFQQVRKPSHASRALLSGAKRPEPFVERTDYLVSA